MNILNQTTGVEEGEQIIHVRNTQLAAALISVGIPLRKDPPYTHVRNAQGDEQWTYCFYSKSLDGTLTTAACIQAWTKDLAWVKENPTHPFAFAMMAVKNYDRMLEHQRDDVPYSAFSVKDDEGNSAVLLTKEGSKKHHNAIAKGYTQI